MLHHCMAPTYSCCYALLNKLQSSYLFCRSLAAVYSHWDGDERREGGKHWQATLESCEHPPAPTGSRIYLPPLPASDSQVDWFMNLCHHVALLCILFCTVVYRGKLLQTALKVPTALKASRVHDQYNCKLKYELADPMLVVMSNSPTTPCFRQSSRLIYESLPLIMLHCFAFCSVPLFTWKTA